MMRSRFTLNSFCTRNTLCKNDFDRLDRLEEKFKKLRRMIEKERCKYLPNSSETAVVPFEPWTKRRIALSLSVLGNERRSPQYNRLCKIPWRIPGVPFPLKWVPNARAVPMKTEELKVSSLERPHQANQEKYLPSCEEIQSLPKAVSLTPTPPKAGSFQGCVDSGKNPYSDFTWLKKACFVGAGVGYFGHQVFLGKATDHKVEVNNSFLESSSKPLTKKPKTDHKVEVNNSFLESSSKPLIEKPKSDVVGADTAILVLREAYELCTLCGAEVNTVNSVFERINKEYL